MVKTYVRRETHKKSKINNRALNRKKKKKKKKKERKKKRVPSCGDVSD